MKQAILVTLFFLGFVSFTYAQKITGKVTDKSTGETVIAATVYVKGNTSTGTVTDMDGNFSLNLSQGAKVLVISYMGMQTQEVPIGNKTWFEIQLVPDSRQIEEVMVTAMGIKREKKALGYAVQELKSDELMKHKDPNVVNSLGGKIAGVNVTNSGGAPGSSSSIIIRGGTSLARDNQPLFVIDGVPIDNSTGQGDNSSFDGSTNSSTTNSNRAMDINPEDIESISVLKGPAAAALYGLRAAAGAVIITTKKGQEGQVAVNFSSRYSTNWVNRLPKQQDLYKQGSYYKSTSLITQTMTSWGDAFAAGETVNNNMDDFFQTASGFDNNVSVSGGTKTGNFFLSASNLDQTGVVPTTDFSKTTFRFNGEQRYGIFTFGSNVSYAESNTTKTLTGSGLWGSSGNGYMEGVTLWPRSDYMKDYLNEDGTKKRMFPNQDLVDDFDNPYWLINYNPQTDKTQRWIASIYAGVKVTDWMDVNYRLGYDSYLTKYQSVTYPGSGVKEAWQKGMLSQSDRSYNYINSNLMVSLHKVFFNDWDASLLLGHSTDDTKLTSNSRRSEQFVIPGRVTDINNATQENQYFSQSNQNKRLIGVYGDFRLAYKSMAFFSMTGRNDWSSTLPQQNRSFFYPSFSGSFVFTEVLPENTILSYGKVRASVAEVGKDASVYQTNTYLFGPETTIGGGFRNSWTGGNSDLKPESTISKEYGAEVRFFNNRLGIDFAYYDNTSKNQIVQPRVSNATGYILKSVNAGEISNKGVELTINATPVQTKKFKWDVMLNMSHNKGYVDGLPGSIPILYVTDVQVGNAKAASFDKGDFMGLSGQEWATDEAGNLILDWKTGYPTTDGLQTKQVGNREASLIGGLNNSLTYKNLNLSFLLDFRLGGDIYNGTEYLMTSYGMSELTENRGDKTTFTGVALNPETKEYEAVTREVSMNEEYYRTQYLWNSHNFIEEVNWLRLRSVSLSYSLPKEFLTKLKYIKQASLNVSGSNLILLTNYSGMDPEVSAAGAGVTGSGSTGIDYCGVPSTAGFTFGVNLTF